MQCQHATMEDIAREVRGSAGAENVSAGSDNSSLSSTNQIDGDNSKQSKKLSSRERATLLTLCFINLLKYMDRFTIAGMQVVIPFISESFSATCYGFL